MNMRILLFRKGSITIASFCILFHVLFFVAVVIQRQDTTSIFIDCIDQVFEGDEGIAVKSNELRFRSTHPLKAGRQAKTISQSSSQHAISKTDQQLVRRSVSATSCLSSVPSYLVFYCIFRI